MNRFAVQMYFLINFFFLIVTTIGTFRFRTVTLFNQAKAIVTAEMVEDKGDAAQGCSGVMTDGRINQLAAGFILKGVVPFHG